MGYLLDLIIAAILVLSIVISVKKGFVKTFISSISLIVAIFVTIACFTPVKQALLETNMSDSIKNSVSVKLTEICPDGDSFDIEQLIQDRPEKFVELTGQFGIDIDALAAEYNVWLADRVDNAQEKMVDYITEKAISLLASAVTVLCLFIGTLIAMKLIELIADRLFRLPVLKQANKLLGFVLGAVSGLLTIYVFTAVVSLLMPYLASKGIQIEPESSLLFSYFYGENNVIVRLLTDK